MYFGVSPYICSYTLQYQVIMYGDREGPDQTAGMHMMFQAFTVCKYPVGTWNG